MDGQTENVNPGLLTTGPAEPTTRDVGSEAEERKPELPEGRNIIIAIGINQYQHQPQLDNPINDAKAILTLFKECGFQELPGVPSLVDNDATRSAIARLPKQLARELKPDDNLVLFYAGHGDKTEEQAPDPAVPGKTRIHRSGYLVPVDGPVDEPGDWISLDWFLDQITSLPARHVLVILDACKSGIALDEKFKSKGVDEPAAIAELRRRASRRVMTSALHDEKAADGGSGTGHSLFAEALIAALRDHQADKDGDGFVKTWDLWSYVQDRVGERAKALYGLSQTPDYGWLPGDGSGDLVISLRTGAFNRLIKKALHAMLCHDVPALEELVAKLVSANPDYPMTIYLQFRLKFMQSDIPAAAQLVSRLRDLNLPPGTLPLSQTELTALSVQLDFWKPVFAIPAGYPPIKITLLTGKDKRNLHDAPLMPGPTGDAYRIENGALAQFQVTNLSNVPVYLYFIAVVPTGRLVIGPLLDPMGWDTLGLGPYDTGVGRVFLAKGLPGSVTDTRILCSPEMLWNLMSPPSIGSRALEPMDAPGLDEMKMMIVYYQVPDDGLANLTDVQTLLSAFDW